MIYGQTETCQVFLASCPLCFVNAEWKLRSFVLATETFSKKNTAYNNAKAYDDAIEKFKLTSKVVSDNASSMVKAFQVYLAQFILYKSDDEIDGYTV